MEEREGIRRSVEEGEEGKKVEESGGGRNIRMKGRKLGVKKRQGKEKGGRRQEVGKRIFTEREREGRAWKERDSWEHPHFHTCPTQGKLANSMDMVTSHARMCLNQSCGQE